MAAALTAEKRIVGCFDGWVLLRDPLELLRGEQRVRLQELPLRILELLLQRPAELVTRDELVARLWPTGIVEFDAGLNTAMRKLRAVLGDDAEAPRYIETVPRQGYRFVGRLEPQAVPIHDAAAPTLELRAEHDPATSSPTVSNRARAPSRRGIAVAAAALLAVAAVVGIILSQHEPVPSTRVVAPHRYRMAVLPFDNLSPDPANAFFADGMHEEVLSALAGRAADLEVISRATMMSYRAAPATTTTKDIARDLGATHVLEGTVRREGDHVRVTMRLVDARADEQVWTETFDSELRNAMTLQADIAARVAERLAIKLSTHPTQLPPSPNREAYDLWLKAALAWQTVGAGDIEVERVDSMFSRAIELDPSYAAAYADRARVHMAKFDRGLDVSEASVASIRADLAAARRLAGDSPHVLVREATLATLVDRDVNTGLALIARAEQAGPLSGDFLMTKANFLRYAGRVDESLAAHARAAELDPGNLAIAVFWMNNLFAARRPDEALRVAESFDRRFPGRIARGEPLFAFTGSTERWRAEAELLRTSNPVAALQVDSDLMRYEGRLEDLVPLLEHAGDVTVRPRGLYGNLLGVPSLPVAELRGWARLLAGDSAGAMQDAAALRAFVDATKPDEWNAWWLRLLEAEEAVFRGDRAKAVERARAALDLGAVIPNLPVTLHVRSTAARVFAWSGAEDEAIALLEGLSDGAPSLGPAAITRDPLLTHPLRRHERFATLEKKLEQQIGANQALLAR